MKSFGLTILISLTLSLAFGQGWERVLSGGGQDEARALVSSADGGYLMTGVYQGVRGILIKTDADGLIQWSKIISSGTTVYNGNSLSLTPDSNIVVVGSTRVSQGNNNSNIWILKTNLFGEKIWEKSLGGNFNDEANSVVVLPNGHFVVVGYASDANNRRDFWVAQFDAAGNLLWEKQYGTPNQNEVARQVIIASNGDLVLVGEVENGPDTDVLIMRLDPAGEWLWENNIGFDFVPNAFSADVGSGIVETADKHFVVAGKTTSLAGLTGGLLMKISGDGKPSPLWFKALPNGNFSSIVSDGKGGFFVGGIKQNSSLNENLYLVRFDDDGDVIWENTVGKAGPDLGLSAVRTADGGLAVAGRTSLSSLLGDTYIYLVKTKANGEVFTNYIEGQVFHDFNNNCQQDGNEPDQQDWIVKIESVDFTRYATTDKNGHFEVLVDTGLYTVTVLPPNSYWENCQPAVVLPIFNFYDTTRLELGTRAVQACPQNIVEVATPVLRRCAENRFTVRYCNLGTIPSINTRIEITVDEWMKVTGSSLAWSQKKDRVYTFNIGFLNAGQCGSFDFKVWLNCDSTETGQAHCVRAHIFPDTLCVAAPQWDKSAIELRGRCQNGNVQFVAKNRGSGNMSQALDFVIVEDQVIFRTGGIIPPLPSGKDSMVFSTLANNKTYRIIASQSAGYPSVSYPTAAVEGCKTDTITNPVSLGYYTMFPEDEAEAYVSVHCQESNPPHFNPAFLKRGHPKGATTERFVQPNTDLSFLIRFVNTGKDTVRQVVVRDTLSAWLDPSSVVPGSASHGYDFQVYAGGVVEFTFPNMRLLPAGSSGSSASFASQGFVHFRVRQRPHLPCPTVIRNRAAIYFDYHQPTYTDATLHTVCPLDSSLLVQSQEVFIPDARVEFFPNPFTDHTNIVVSGVSARVFTLEMYDLLGRRLIQQTSQQPNFRLSVHHIPRGIFLYRLAADGKPIASGKAVAMEK